MKSLGCAGLPGLVSAPAAGMQRACHPASLGSALAVWLLLSWGGALSARTPVSAQSDLADLSIEELMKIEVTTVSKTEESLWNTPAAAYVLTREQIRRSGARTLPEALRLVPGVHVAQIDAQRWAVSIRGFQSRFANKLLVLVDGRSIYTPVFSGVYWEQRGVFLEDVERIEVIRGPGATTWGTNAVNGVINIITRSAFETEETFLETGFGTRERARVAVRHGDRLGDRASYRIYGQFSDRNEAVRSNGEGANDAWKSTFGGLRLDWHASSRDAFMLQGEAREGDLDREVSVPSLVPPFSRLVEDSGGFSGGHLLARWTRELSTTSGLELTYSYDEMDRSDTSGELDMATHRIEVLHNLVLGSRHEVQWSADYRFTRGRFDRSFQVGFPEAELSNDWLSFSVQDQITLWPDRLTLTLGTKVEENDFSGVELQPTARFLLRPDQESALWGAVTRAVRSPSWADVWLEANTAVIPEPETGLPLVVRLLGNRSYGPEELVAWEMGYRTRVRSAVTLDVALFHHSYDGLASLRAEPTFPESIPEPIHLVAPLRLANGTSGSSYGLEATAKWSPRPNWVLEAGYSYIDLELERPDGNTARALEGSAPRHEIALSSALEIGPRLDLDVFLSYVDRLETFDAPSYLRFDVRASWRLRRGLSVYWSGKNLTEPRHREGGVEFLGSALEVPRSFQIGFRWSS